MLNLVPFRIFFLQINIFFRGKKFKLFLFDPCFPGLGRDRSLADIKDLFQKGLKAICCLFMIKDFIKSFGNGEKILI